MSGADSEKEINLGSSMSELIPQLIRRVGSASPDDRQEAARELRKLARSGLRREDSERLLRAAAQPLPAGKHDFDDPASILVAAAQSNAGSWSIPLILELFSRYPQPARREALYLLAGLSELEAALAFMRLLREHRGSLPRIYPGPLVQSLKHPDVFYPELLDYVDDPKLREMIFNVTLAYCSKGALDTAMLAARAPAILERYLELRSQMLPLQQEPRIGWIWTDEYVFLRGEAEVLLDLLGYIPASAVKAELLRAVGDWRDPRLKCFAITSAIRQGAEVEGRHVTEVANSAEMRSTFYRLLRELGKESLYPRDLLNQEAFAESDLVNWLTYPTELGRVPDEIQLMAVVSFDTGGPGGETYDYYVFRFRTHPPHWAAKDDWLAGVSGPFKRSQEPTPDAGGETFSQFEAWDSKSPEEHVGDLQQHLDKARESGEGRPGQ
jgi:hypothetical protein